jgi:hypothetical protein
MSVVEPVVLAALIAESPAPVVAPVSVEALLVV